MRVTYLKLKNIATIFAGMKKKEIEIHFPISTKRITLLIGRNGTGKSAIMREIHPFAFSSDIRGKAILAGQPGYKEIHYRNGSDIYIIKHHYQPNSKDGWNTKSFIMKNGEELNGNGNVTSFNELVEKELGIVQSHLDLLHLASNLSGFIDKKATERKSYASDLLKELDVYAHLYKKVSDDHRVMKSMIKSVVDKLDKLRVYSEDDEKAHLKTLEEKRSEYQTQRNQLSNDRGILTGTLQALIPQGIDSFMSDLEAYRREVRLLSNELESIRLKKKSMSLVLLNEIHEAIANTEKSLQEKLSEQQVTQQMIEFYITQLNQLYQQKEEKDGNLKYMSSDVEYSQINSMYLELKQKRKEKEKTYENFTPWSTHAEMLMAISVLQQIGYLIQGIFEYDRNAIRDVVRMMIEGVSVEGFVRKQIEGIDQKITSLRGRADYKKNENNIPEGKMYVMVKPHDCNCPFQQFYYDVTGKHPEEQKTAADYEREAFQLEFQRDTYVTYIDILRKIEYVFVGIKTNMAVLSKLPVQEIISQKYILNSIREGQLFYDEDELTNYVSILEDYEEYVNLDKLIYETKREIDFIAKNGNNINSLREEIARVDKDIHLNEEKLNDLKRHSEEILSQIEQHQHLLEVLNMYDELEREEKITSDKLNEKLIAIEKSQDIEIRLTEIKKQTADLQYQEQRIDHEIKSLDDQMDGVRIRLQQFRSLHEERERLEEEFDEINIVREALSTNKGLPLLYITLYLKDIRSTVNSLLHEVYGGALEIEEAVVNEKEFRIPFTKNGITVEDVAMCSQGERAFIGMAMSFALTSYSIEDYDIMKLDEVDSTLDEVNRMVFIPSLDKLLDRIGSEQAFVITHNNQFDNYPVDAIITSREGVNIDNYRNVNIIFEP